MTKSIDQVLVIYCRNPPTVTLSMTSLSTATTPTRLALLNPERSGSGKQVVNLESCFFRWGLEPTLNALLHAWNKGSVAELLPTIF